MAHLDRPAMDSGVSARAKPDRRRVSREGPPTLTASDCETAGEAIAGKHACDADIAAVRASGWASPATAPGARTVAAEAVDQ